MADKGRLRRMLLQEGGETRRGNLALRLTLIGVVGAGVLLAIVLAIDSPTPERPRDIAEIDVTDLIGPSALQETGSTDMLDPSMQLDLPGGGWIQIADKRGNPSQQYRCEHLDPNPSHLPAHWIDMTRPQVELFLENDRLMTIEGDKAETYAPNRALEKGWITGNVRINLYEPVDGRTADPAVHPPSVEMRPERVAFDNYLGKITCKGRIEVHTPTEEMVGSNMEVLVDDATDRVKFMRINELDYLLIRPDSSALALDTRPGWPRRAETEHPPVHDGTRSSSVIPVAMQQGKSGPESAAMDTEFYTLTLRENVRIMQGDARGGRTVTGNQLDVTFSLDQSSRGDSIVMASAHAEPQRELGPQPHWVELVLASTLGHRLAPSVGPDDTLVTCDDGMIMVPANDSGSVILQDPDDTLAELQGTPVFIFDAGEQTEITCDRLVYRGLEDRFDLYADEGREVILEDPRLLARGTHLWVAQERGEGGFIDPGTISILDRDQVALASVSVLPPAANTSIDLEDQVEDTPPESELDITWTEGVDISFDSTDSSDDPSIQDIIFRGDVDVVSPDGLFSSNWMRMFFEKDDEQKAVPSRLLAREQVKAENEDQTIWADDLEVTFLVEDVEGEPDEEPTGSRSLMGSGTRVKDVLANGDVQVLMSDGARVFADHLVADAKQEQVVLTGEDVVIARDDMLIDHGRHVELERRNGTATWIGPGQARLLTRPLDLSADQRIDRPEVPRPAPGDDASVTMRARWNTSMQYDSRFNDGAGSIELDGDVAVVAQPKPHELDRLEGQKMVLQFVDAGKVDSESLSSNLRKNQEDDPFDIERSSRVLETLIARGDAKLEQRTWPDEQRASIPNVFYIAAKHITWNDLETSAEVIGDGELVLREAPPVDGATPESGLFRGPGVSRFIWTRRLDMVQDESGGFTIDMDGDVEGLYKGMEDEDTATITAQHVKAVTAPIEEAEGRGGSAPGEGVLDLGRDMEIERLFAEGSVYISTPRRRVDCNLFDYNLSTGLAKLDSVPGRTVSILTEGSPTPVRAGSVLWNMDPAIDTITITDARGGAVNP